MKKGFTPFGRIRLWSVLLIFGLLCCQLSFGQQTLRVYLVGNSVTDAINYNGFKAIAQSTGNTHIWARHMIPGAPLEWLWTHMADGFTESPYGSPTNAFPNYVWDAISLQPFDRNIEGTNNDKEMVGNYINLAKTNSPNVQFYIYMRWPRTPDSKLPTDASLTADTWTNLWTRTYTGGWDGTNETKDFFEDLLVACRAAYTTVKPVLMVPVGEVFYQLNLKMKAGQVPGYSKIWQVYSDGIHMNNVGSYIGGLTFYSTMYKADPRGTTVPSEYGTIDSNLASIIQQTVWDVVSTYQYSGVTSSNVAVTSVSVAPTTLSLTNGQTSQLTATVLPSNATNKSVTWSSSNALVATVSNSGLVTATGAGSATITVTTADGNKTATCAVTVTTSGGGGGTTSGILSNWDFAGKGGQSSVAGANLLSGVASASASIGSGMTAINYLSDGLTASNHNSATLAEAITNNDYITFTITPSSGQSLTVSTIKITPVSQNRLRTFALLSSKNGFTSANVLASFDASANSNGTQQTLSISGHSGLTSAIEFRLYIYGTGYNVYEAVGMGNASGVDLEVSGSVSGGSDTQAPTAASNLTTANVKDTRFDLSWTNATDNVGVTGYDVFAGTTKLNSSLLTTNSYQVTGRTACTTYSITVKAYDAAGNSSTSTALNVKTNCAPTAVLNATPASGTAPLNVSFNATGSTDPDADDFILGYDWDFGDGSAKDNSNAPSHNYTAAGTYTVTLRVMDNRDLYSSPVTKTITVSAPSATLPSPWQKQDIGSVGVAGNASYSSPAFTVTGSGSDIWGTADGFQYVYQTLSGDGEIVAKVTSQTNSDGWAKAGVMIRETLTAGSKHAMTVITPSNGVSFQRRLTADASSESSTTTGIVAPIWVKIVRSGNSFTSFQSTNGTSWTQIGSAVTISMATNVYVGLCVTSHNNATTSTATFESVAVSGPARTPENPANTVNGLTYKYFEGSWDLLPNFASLTPVKSGEVANFDLTVRNVNDNFAFEYKGYVNVPTDGEYTFYTSSDDGSKLYIGSTEVVNNDGLHGSVEKSGKIALKAGKHAITVTMFEKTGGEVLEVSYEGPGISKQLIPASALYRVNTIQTGSIVMEYWEGISGTAVSAIPVSTTPTGTQTLTSLEGPTNWKDNYGVRIRGYVVPSTTGSYTFFVAGDDNSELWLSTSENVANKAKIAQVSSWTNSREWTKEAGQTSAAISLNANTKYYVEVLMKEGGGGDNIAVGWTGPGISTITVIGSANISPYVVTGDQSAPSTPGNLTASNIASTSLTLSWTASTDDVGVTGYDVLRGTTLLGTTSNLTYNVTGLTASTQYTFNVKAKDASGKSSNAASVTATTSSSGGGGTTPQLPIGMNIHGLNYYTSGLIFTDAMTASGDMFTFYDGGPWNSEKIGEIARDANGWPTAVPVATSDGKQSKVRFLINSYYNGRHVLTFDGSGTINISGVTNTKVTDNKYYIDFNGSGGNAWIDISQSTSGNHIKNMKILPVAYENGGTYPTFNAKFLDGLRPFHAIRFMDWIGTNGSNQKFWSDRATKTYYSQGTNRGCSYEYAIELCNELGMDAWVTIPHQADDNYITLAARLWRDNLNSTNKVYIEYSNEIWNWQFAQAGYCVNNAPGHPNSYVSSDLAAIAPAGSNHPEKDAYMMARTFRLWKAEFTGANATRLVRTAAVQHGWMDNTRRVLEYLFNTQASKAGCDVVSPAGYFNFDEDDHNRWNSLCASVTPSEILDSVLAEYDRTSGYWTQKTAEYANQYGVGYVVYEGGQHMQPWMQGDWCYNNAVWDAQIHSKMYDVYMKNFRKHVEPAVNCQLFMAFAYLSDRQSKYGSWGHLENLAQIGSVSNYMTIAPKYQALLDANTPRSAFKSTEAGSASTNDRSLDSDNKVSVYPNPATDVIYVSPGAVEGSWNVRLINRYGQVVKAAAYVSNGDNTAEQLSVSDLSSGLYFVEITTQNDKQVVKVIKK